MHPLSPPSLSLGEAIAAMLCASHISRRPWYVVEGYQIADDDDLAIYYPDAAIVARSHCPSCGDKLSDPAALICAACTQVERMHMFNEVYYHTHLAA